MNDYRDGDSFVWKYAVGNDVYYSIWHDGEGSTPVLSDQSGTTTQWVWKKVKYCRKYKWNGKCKKWGSRWEQVEETVEVEAWNWYVVYNDAINSGGDTEDFWSKTPYDGNDGDADAGDGATRMTWDEVWAEIPPEYFSDYILYDMDTLSNTERNVYENAMVSVGGSSKNTQMADICSASKANGIIIFTIGLEVTESNAQRLESCASEVSFYYDVENIEIDNAFASIAAQISQLRLVQ